jgi:hypothetical protein
MAQELYPRKILTLTTLPAVSSTYTNTTVCVGGKFYFCDGTNWQEIAFTTVPEFRKHFLLMGG